MEVTYIDHGSSGDDLRVVNAARVSFHKESHWMLEGASADGTVDTYYEKPVLHESDVKLINYLAKHNHFTPFTHCRETFVSKYYGSPMIELKELNETDRAGLIYDVDLNRWRHSLYGWANLLKKGLVDEDCVPAICAYLHNKYPVS